MKMIFRASPIDMLEVNTNAEWVVLLGDHDHIGKPLGVVNLSDELSRQEPSHLFTNSFPLLYGGPTKMFLDWFHFWVDSQMVLSQSPGYTRHVSRLPCEDVPVLMEELDERFFLFAVE